MLVKGGPGAKVSTVLTEYSLYIASLIWKYYNYGEQYQKIYINALKKKFPVFKELEHSFKTWSIFMWIPSARYVLHL